MPNNKMRIVLSLKAILLLYFFVFSNIVIERVHAQFGQVGVNCVGVLSVTEQTICSSVELTTLDSSLAQLTFQVLPTLPTSMNFEFQRQQDDFLRARNSCGDSVDCLSFQYQNRIREINQFLFNIPSQPVVSRDETTQTEEQRSPNLQNGTPSQLRFDPTSYPASGIGYGGDLRAGPGNQYAVVGKVDQYEAIMIYSKSNVTTDGYNWFVIQSVSGQKGYFWGGTMCNFFNRNDAFVCPPVR